MISDVINSKIRAGKIILYRRVSTKDQARSEYKSQLKKIKSTYPNFSIDKSTIDHRAEVMSGLAEPEVRFASGLGTLLKLLKRNPHAILLVSTADRISRRADIFELIQCQHLGHQVYDASTGFSLNDIVRKGRHKEIERETERLRAARQTGLNRRKASGRLVGSQGISDFSNQGAAKKKELAKQREKAVLGVVSRLTFHSHGQTPSMKELANELDRLEIRTGQGLFFTPARLSQLKKKNPLKWQFAYDSYHRPRRRIRQKITAIQVEIRERRNRKRAMAILSGCLAFDPRVADIEQEGRSLLEILPDRAADKVQICSCRKGCRGPPETAYLCMVSDVRETDRACSNR